MISGLSWGAFVIVVLGVSAFGLLLLGLGVFVRDEIVNVEDPEDRWAREAQETRR